MEDEKKPRQSWTPGPWTLGNENNYSCEVCLSVGDSELVISLGRHDTLTGRECVISREEMLSNAHLVISAPAMAEALAELVIAFEGTQQAPDDGSSVRWVRLIRSAEKARDVLDAADWKWGGR